MNIFQTKTDDNKYRVTIYSENPILVTYHDLIDKGFEMDMSTDDIRFCLRHDEYPTPINHNGRCDGALEDGIWVYERLFAFFDWMLNRSAYAQMLSGTKTDVTIG